MNVIRIGTRRSMLAMAQSGMVADAIRSRCGVEVELVPITTSGDRRRGPLADAGGKGLFTAELEAALRRGEIHLAVHSAKDLPTAISEDLVIASVPARADPRDALVSPDAGGVEDLPTGASVGTGSLRRSAQLLAIRGDLKIVPIRGNVETRLRKAVAGAPGGLDAVMLAMAGMVRSGLLASYARHIRPLDLSQCIPAAGQGALAVEAAAAARDITDLVAVIDDPPSHQALLAERAVLEGLRADCHSCVAVHVAPAEGGWQARGMVALPDGTGMVRREEMGGTAAEAGRRLCDALRRVAPPGLFSS